MQTLCDISRIPPPSSACRARLPAVVRAGARVLLCSALLSPATALALDRYQGSAYSERDGSLLYRETHWRYQDLGKPARLVVYSCADGTPFARKRVWSGAQASAPDFEFIDARDGYREGVRRTSGRREVYVQANAKAPLRSRAIDAPANAVIDAGFDAFVRAQWPALAKGGKVTAKFLLPSRQSFLGVGIRKVDAAAAASADELRLRMNLDAWYGFAVPETTLTYQTKTRWLRRFEGIGTIRDAKGRNQAVRIEFPQQPAAGATQADLQAALAAPLQRQCRG